MQNPPRLRSQLSGSGRGARPPDMAASPRGARGAEELVGPPLLPAVSGSRAAAAGFGVPARVSSVRTAPTVSSHRRFLQIQAVESGDSHDADVRIEQFPRFRQVTALSR